MVGPFFLGVKLCTKNPPPFLFWLSEGTFGLLLPPKRTWIIFQPWIFRGWDGCLGRVLQPGGGPPGALTFTFSKNKKRKGKFTKIPGLLGDTDSRIFGVFRSAAAAPWNNATDGRCGWPFFNGWGITKSFRYLKWYCTLWGCFWGWENSLT